jgi:peptide/nickel transport system substrate-binding protein
VGLEPQPTMTIVQESVQMDDPHVWTDSRDRLNTRLAVYEPLLQHDRRGGHRPALAAGWATDDARTWSFALRPGVRFHDRSRLTAEDVVESLNRARGEGMAGDLGTSGIFHAYLGRAHIEASGRDRVQIVTAQPMADLPDVLADIPIMPAWAAARSPDSVPGTGPYRLIEQRTGHLVMEAVDEYWGGRAPVSELHWRAERDEPTRVSRLLAGGADVATAVAPGSLSAIQAEGKAAVLAWTSHVCVILMCNAARGPCADRRVRQALNYAIGLNTIIDEVKHGAARPLNGPLTPLHLGYDPAVPPYPRDPDAARALLAEAGYGSGLDLVVDIPEILPNEAPRLAEALSAQYARVGITTAIRTFTDRPAYAEMVKAKRMDDLACFDSSPLSTFRVLREKFHSQVAGPWWQGYRNLDVDRYLDEAAATPDLSARRRIYQHAYRLIRDEAPWVFLYSPTMLLGVSPRARGLEVDGPGTLRVM